MPVFTAAHSRNTRAHTCSENHTLVEKSPALMVQSDVPSCDADDATVQIHPQCHQKKSSRENYTNTMRHSQTLFCTHTHT